MQNESALTCFLVAEIIANKMEDCENGILFCYILIECFYIARDTETCMSVCLRE